MSRAVSIDVGGSTCKISTTESAERMHELADELNRRIAALQARSPRSLGERRLMMFVALDLVDDLLRAQEEEQALRERTHDVIQRVIARIDTELGKL